MADPVHNVLTNDEITLRALMHFRNSCKAVRLADQQHAGDFAKKGGQIGDTIQVRKPDFGTVYKTRTRVLSKIDEQKVPLTLNRWRGTAFKLTSKELLLDINSLDKQVIKPRMHKLAATVDQEVLEDMAFAAYSSVGVLGTNPSSLKTYLQAGAELDNYGTLRGPGERNLFITPNMQAEIADSIRAIFNPTSTISDTYSSGVMDGYAQGMNWNMDQSCPPFTAGSRAKTGKLVSGTGQSGSSITIDALGSGKTAKKGDRVTLAAVNAVNPVTGQDLGALKSFVLTADVAANGTALKIAPAIVLTGSHKNVSAGPADNAAVSFLDAISGTGVLGVLAHKMGLTCAFVPLENTPSDGAKIVHKMDDVSGIGITCASQFVIADHATEYRMDLLYGTLAQRPEYICAIRGKN